MPFLVTLRERGDAYVADRFLRASDLGETSENAEWKTVVLDEATGEPVVPNGSIGFRWGEEGEGRWNLDMGGVTPALEILGRHDELVPLDLSHFDVPGTEGGGAHRRGRRRPADRRDARHDGLRAAGRPARGQARGDLPGDWPEGLDDPARLHAGLAGADHGRGRRDGRAGRARVRPQRRALARALDDHDGRGHQPLVPLRPDLPRDADPGAAVRLPGRQRRRLGALRGPGEGAAHHRVGDAGVRAGLVAAARASRRRPPTGS